MTASSIVANDDDYPLPPPAINNIDLMTNGTHQPTEV
jgi:hypothetical protein